MSRSKTVAAGQPTVGPRVETLLRKELERHGTQAPPEGLADPQLSETVSEAVRLQGHGSALTARGARAVGDVFSGVVSDVETALKLRAADGAPQVAQLGRLGGQASALPVAWVSAQRLGVRPHHQVATVVTAYDGAELPPAGDAWSARIVLHTAKDPVSGEMQVARYGAEEGYQSLEAAIDAAKSNGTWHVTVGVFEDPTAHRFHLLGLDRMKREVISVPPYSRDAGVGFVLDAREALEFSGARDGFHAVVGPGVGVIAPWAMYEGNKIL